MLDLTLEDLQNIKRGLQELRFLVQSSVRVVAQRERELRSIEETAVKVKELLGKLDSGT